MTYSNFSIISEESGLYKYLQEINAIPSLTNEEEFSLARAYIENQDLSSAQKLVTSHLKLVAKIALTYRNYGLPLIELISEGNMGLMHAVKKYNPDLGFRLSTYAMFWIKAAIQEYILKSWSLVKIGTTAAQKKLFFSLKKIKRKLSNLYLRSINENDHAEIAQELGVDISEVTEMDNRLLNKDLSLNSPISINNEVTEVIDLLPEKRPNPEMLFLSKEDSRHKKNLLAKGISNLTPREKDIFQARRLSDNIATLDMLSNKYNISKERVRQIENKAFDKVKEFILKNAIV